MKNKIDDLRNHLFAALEGLADPEKPMELDRARALADVARYTPADRERTVSQIAPCPDCGGALRFDTRDGVLLEICDRCEAAMRRAHRPPPSTSETPAMSATATPGARGTPPHAPLGKAPLLAPPVVGKPCPHCGQRVKARPPCRKCKKNPPRAGGRLCESCTKPKSELRYCVKCGTRFEFVFGQTKGKGQSQYDMSRCPAHRKKSKA